MAASPRPVGALVLLLSALVALRPRLLFLAPAGSRGPSAGQMPAAVEPQPWLADEGRAAFRLLQGGVALLSAAIGLAACKRSALLGRTAWRQNVAVRRAESKEVSGKSPAAPSYTSGIYVVIYAKDAESAPAVVQFLKEHFGRQLDGREPGAITCTLAPPSDDEPTAIRLFELWETADDYAAHVASDNLKVNTENITPLVDMGRIAVVKSDEVEHFTQGEYAGEPRVGIAVDLKAKDEESAKKVVSFSREHFGRQFDGREPGATSAAIIPPTADEPTTIRYFEHWRTDEDYASHQASEHLELHLQNISPLILAETLRIIPFSGAQQFGRSGGR